MAQKRIRSAGEDGGQAAAMWREVGVTHGVDARMEAVETTRVNRAIHSAAGVAKRPGQLANRNDAMLPLCELRKVSAYPRRLLRPFVPHSGANDRSARSLPYPACFSSLDSALSAKSRRRWAGGFWNFAALWS